MTSPERRLRLLETTIRPRTPDAVSRDLLTAWYRTVTDDDLDVLATVAECMKTGGDVEALSVDVTLTMARLRADFDRFHAENESGNP